MIGIRKGSIILTTTHMGWRKRIRISGELGHQELRLVPFRLAAILQNEQH